MTATTDSLRAALGRSRRVEALLDPFPVRALQAALDREPLAGPDDPLPPGWHHLYFHEPVFARDTGIDGHERLGRFLPALEGVRRMWAGGRLRFERPLRLGTRAVKTSTIRAITPKQGRSGRLVFVTVEHRIDDGDGTALVEEQQIVYREPRPLARCHEPFTPPHTPVAEARYCPDEVLLFRYSALTWNSHRIHYDRRYACEVEGYPDLVVHGPLLALLGLMLAADHHGAARIAAFDFRNHAPLFVGRPLRILLGPEAERTAPLWVVGEDGRLALAGTLALRPTD